MPWYHLDSPQQKSRGLERAVSGAPVTAYSCFDRRLGSEFVAVPSAASHLPAALWGRPGAITCLRHRTYCSQYFTISDKESQSCVLYILCSLS